VALAEQFVDPAGIVSVTSRTESGFASPPARLNPVSSPWVLTLSRSAICVLFPLFRWTTVWVTGIANR